jgi:hypothetical protein
VVALAITCCELAIVTRGLSSKSTPTAGLRGPAAALKFAP